MSTDPTRIVIAGRAHVYLATLGTVAPADSSVALGVGWAEVGLTTEDSLAFNTNPTFGQVRSHQSDYPTRTFQQADEAHLEVDLQEFSGDNLVAVFGGGTVEEITAPVGGTPGEYKYTPPAIGGRSNVACIAEVIDGAKRYRFVIPNCFQDAGVSMKLQKRAETALPLRLAVIGTDSTDPWYVLSNDPAIPLAA